MLESTLSLIRPVSVSFLLCKDKLFRITTQEKSDLFLFKLFCLKIRLYCIKAISLSSNQLKVLWELRNVLRKLSVK
jgi:hypothetical protein